MQEVGVEAGGVEAGGGVVGRQQLIIIHEQSRALAIYKNAKGGRRIKGEPQTPTFPSSHLLIWVVTEQSACGNLWLERN